MAEIPSGFWIVAGIAIAITSWYVKGRMFLFFYVGLFFILIGLFKMFRGKNVKMQKKTSMHGVCPRCRKKVGHVNFCFYCGARLR